ncbi:MAG TPA: ureidoglycolate lyase [Candidatus Competibacteraceae bacterium]|nr:ureidoglycolate lyase [Candidatus Competibacteraceae bacterium]
MLRLCTEPLTREAFAPFGDVIETEGRDAFLINWGRTQRFHDLARVEIEGPDARPLINIFRSQPWALPVEIRMLERHPLGSQAFMPLSEEPFLVVVAPPGETFSAADIRAFLTNGRQGVNYARGTWHHPVLALNRMSDFLVVDRGGPGHNCDERELTEPVLVELA